MKEATLKKSCSKLSINPSTVSKALKKTIQTLFKDKRAKYSQQKNPNHSPNFAVNLRTKKESKTTV
jgi:hypothetical protein